LKTPLFKSRTTHSRVVRHNKRMNEEINLAGRPYIFRFRQNTERTIEEIAENYIYFPDRESLNDPFDSSPDLVYLTKNPEATSKLYQLVSEGITDKAVKKHFDSKYDLDKLQEFAHEKVKDFILEFGVACFSMYYMNLPLWANYANDHKGVCLQFDSDIDKDFFSVLGPVSYVEDLTKLEFSPIIEDSDMGKIFYRKAISWSYEKEVRLVKGFKGKANYNKRALRNVILGYNSDDAFRDKIVEAVNKNHEDVGVYKMEKPTKINKFTLTKIK